MKNGPGEREPILTHYGTFWLIVLGLGVAASLMFGACSSSSSSNGTSSGGGANPVAAQRDAMRIQPAKRGDLCRAARDGDKDKVNALIHAGADVNENLGNAQNQITPLLIAAAYDRTEIVRILIAAGARKSASYEGYTPEEFQLYSENPINTAYAAPSDVSTSPNGGGLDQ